MSDKRGASKGMLLLLIGTVIVFLLMLVFGGCNSNNSTFYLTEKNCLVVQKQDTINCYKTYGAYAMHEGYSLDHAKQIFNANKLEAERRQKMRKRAETESMKIFPVPGKEENYFRKQAMKDIQRQRDSLN